MKEKKDSHKVRLRSPQASLSATIIQKLSTIEDLLKKKDDKPLTFKEACSYLGYASSYLYKLTYKKIIPHYKPTGKMIFFSKNELGQWIFKSRPLPKGEEEITKDPNQFEMELKEELVIEFPLKSRRKQ